jgi:hypothetical protein
MGAVENKVCLGYRNRSQRLRKPRPSDAGRANSVSEVGAVVRSLHDKEIDLAQKEDEQAAVVTKLDADEADVQQQLDQFWQIVDQIGARNADKDPDKVLRFVTEVVEEVRQEHYEREQREGSRQQ